MKKTFLATVEEGKVELEDKASFQKFCAKKKGRLFITVSHMQKPRSNNQNRYYWGVVIKLLCEHTGQDPDDMHAFLGSKFLSHEMEIEGPNKSKEIVKVTKSTKDLSTIAFEDYMSECRMWSSMFLSVAIPEPNECAGSYAEYFYDPKQLEK